MSTVRTVGAADVVQALLLRERPAIHALRQRFSSGLRADPEAALESCHVLVRREPLPASVLGVLHPTPGGPMYCVVPSWLSARGQRFSLAHELAHLLLHRQRPYHCDRRARWVWEVEANAWAAEFLMPADTVRDLVAGLDATPAAVKQMAMVVAQAMDVSLEAAWWRLYELDITSVPPGSGIVGSARGSTLRRPTGRT